MITLRNRSSAGEPLEAVFLPDRGMNMISYRKGGIEVIDQSTRPEFERRFSGLGPMIGPHFHRRNPNVIPKINNESLFPHIAHLNASEAQDPFSHGIGRYAPWKAQATETTISATLSGKDSWQGIQLSELEGQNFKMQFNVKLAPDGLHLALSVVSDFDSLVGIHYFYALPQGRGTVISDVKRHYLDGLAVKEIPQDWHYKDHLLTYELNQQTDFAFHPFFNPLSGKILLDAGTYKLETRYTCQSQENSWQLYHPQGASFVCVEPVSSQNPRRANLTASSINISLEIFT